MVELKMLEGETEQQTIYRICSAKDEIGNWKQVADVLNLILGHNYDESTYRKKVQAFNGMFEANESKFIADNEYLNQLREERQELYKEKVKVQDERNQLRKLLREQARRESYLDIVKEILCENVEPIKLDIDRIDFTSTLSTENDLIVPFVDIHTGIEIDNWKNTFNEVVLKERLQTYIQKIIEIQKTHRAENCYVVIGEVVSGIIHSNLRLENNMNLMEQFKYVVDLLSACLSVLSIYFNKIYVYTTPGNHSRITPDKKQSLDGENMDILVPFYLKPNLKEYENIIIEDNDVDPEIAIFNVRGNKVYALHGHKDKISEVSANLTMMFGEKPDIIIMEHMHTNCFITDDEVKVIQSGCISGADTYSLNIRKISRPEQLVSVVDKNGIVCLYDIQLD